MNYYEALEAEMDDEGPDPDPLAEYEFAVFFPRMSDSRPHRGPYAGTAGLETCKQWAAAAVIDGFPPNLFTIRERRINEWREIDAN